MRKITKLMLTLALLIVGVGGAKAVTLNASFQKPADNGAWNGETNTYTWTASYNNLMTIFEFPNGELTNYTKIHLEVAQTTHHNFRFCLMNGSTTLGTVVCWSSGTKDITFSEHNDTKNVDLSQVTHIAFGGASAPGEGEDPYSCVLTNVYLEGPDPLYRDVYELGNRITFAEALASSDPFVVVQNNKVLCGPLSPSDGSLTFKDVSEIINYSWVINFEEDADNAGSYFMELRNSNGASKGYINASVWSHTYLSGVDKSGKKGEQQDGALWTITETGTGTGKYTIKNLGVTEGNYNNKPGEGDGDRAAKGQGYLGITPDGYWANHVTIYNTSGEWEFYTLNVIQLPINDPYYFGWDNLIFSGSDKVTKDDETHFVRDANDWAAYWSESAKWELGSPIDVSKYRYLVYYTQRNITRFGNEDNNTGGSVFIKDNNGVTFRGDDYNNYKAEGAADAVNYPAHTGAMWMNIWNKQRATVVDLQWLANNNKYGDGSECKVLDITKIKAFGFSGDFTIGGAFFTNTLPDLENGDYKRTFTNEETPVYGNFGTVCLPYSAVCCGAQLYQITGKTANGIVISEYEGVMAAGKAYFYKTLEAKQQYWGNVRPETAVYFFKAGYSQEDAPVANNGLIGTFSNTKAPKGSNYFVLSGNKLYNVDDAAEVTVGANKAYINIDGIESVANARPSLFINFDGDEETTGVNEAVVKGEKIANSAFFNLNGQRVSKPTKGLYVVNGKKIMVK